MKTIFKNVEKLRKERKISQTELADAIGMTQTGLSQAIKRQDIKLSTLEKISDFFEVDIDVILKDVGGLNPVGPLAISSKDRHKDLLNQRNEIKQKNKILEKELEKLKKLINNDGKLLQENKYLKKEVELLKVQIIDLREIIELLKKNRTV